MTERMLDDLLIISVSFLGGSAGLYAASNGHGFLGLGLSLIGMVFLFLLRLFWFFEDNVGRYPYYSLADLYPVLGRWVAEAADG